MEPTRTDSAPRSVTLTAYDFAMEEVAAASSRLAHALSARPQIRADAATIEQECADARSIYERMLHLYPRVRLDDARRASLLKELGLLRSSLKECETQEARSRPSRR